MRRLALSANASRDAALILRASRARFGPAARARYAQLLKAVYADLQANPTRVGVRPARDADVHSYAIRYSRAQCPRTAPGLKASIRLYPLRMTSRRGAPSHRVGRPRHLVVFRDDERELHIIRGVHDRMDAKGQLGGG